MKKIFSVMIGIVFAVMLWGTFTVGAEANANQSGQIMAVTEETDVKESPDENSETIVTFAAGNTVFVTGEQGDWYIVFYQGKNGYVQKECVQSGEAENQDYLAALDEEMHTTQAENKMVVEEIERRREEKKHSIIWGVVIVALIIGIFATGIISTVKNGKKEDDAELEVIDLDEENE